MSIEESSNYTHKIVLEGHESLCITHDDEEYMILEHGDDGAPDAECKAKSTVIIIRSQE